MRSLKSNVVFTSGPGAMINRSGLMRAFAIAVKKAGLVGVTSHKCRHSFCTRLAQKGIDIYKIAKLAGHEDIRMTQRYSHHCSESLRDGVEILDSDYNLTDLRKIFTCKSRLRALLTINYNNNLVYGRRDCRQCADH